MQSFHYHYAMKKIISLAIAVLMAFSVSAAAEPFVTLSTAVPGLLYAVDGRSEYDVSVQYGYPAGNIIAFPFLAEDSGLSLDDILSDSIVGQGRAFWDALMLYAALDDFSVVDGRGMIRLSPMMDFEGGIASLAVSYDDVSMLYRAGGWTDTADIDGVSVAEASWRTDPLLTLSVSADTTLSGKGSVELSFYLDEDMLDSYLGFIGASRDELREYAMEVASYELPEDLISLIAGIDAGSASYVDIIGVLEEHRMLDILDFIGFVAIASDDSRLSETDPFLMCLVPVLSVDGKVVDVDMKSLMKDAVRLAGLADIM